MKFRIDKPALIKHCFRLDGRCNGTTSFVWKEQRRVKGARTITRAKVPSRKYGWNTRVTPRLPLDFRSVSWPAAFVIGSSTAFHQLVGKTRFVAQKTRSRKKWKFQSIKIRRSTCSLSRRGAERNLPYFRQIYVQPRTFGSLNWNLILRSVANIWHVNVRGIARKFIVYARNRLVIKSRYGKKKKERKRETKRRNVENGRSW